MDTCKICLVSTVQTSFWGSSEKLYEKRYIPQMEALAEKLGFELHCVRQAITSPAQALAIQAEIKQGGYDLLLIQVSTFADGGIIAPLAEAGVRLGLWAVPELSKDGAIPNNSFCGVNMYASILRHYLGGQTPYKWFYGEVEDPLFARRFQVTVSALKAMKRLSGAKVALIGDIAPGFHDLCFDDRKLRNKLGVTVSRAHEFCDIRDLALTMPKDQVQAAVEAIRAESACVASDLAGEGLENTARVYLAFESLIKQEGYDAIAISCWPRFRKELGIVVCAVIGRLLENGHVAACEGDVDSAISMLMLRTLAGEEPMLMDLSQFDPEDGSILMWHCGSAPKRYADKAGCAFDGHYKPGSRVTLMDDVRVSGVNNMYYQPRPVTVARFTEDYEKILTFSGSFIDKANRAYDGSRGWIGDLKSDGQPLDTLNLVNTILSQGFQHHYPIVGGNVEEEVREVMAWLNIAPVEQIAYRNYLQKPTV